MQNPHPFPLTLLTFTFHLESHLHASYFFDSGGGFALRQLGKPGLSYEKEKKKLTILIYIFAYDDSSWLISDLLHGFGTIWHLDYHYERAYFFPVTMSLLKRLPPPLGCV